jgi:hypothetical protein
MKPVEERKAKGWLRANCNNFDGNVELLADAVCDFLGLYAEDGSVPVRLIELAKETMESHK